MRKFAICSGFAVLGFAIAAALYLTVGILILNAMQHQGGGAPEDYLGIAFMVVLPLCLFIGSIASGSLCQPYIRNPYLFVLLSPGIYSGIGTILTSGGTIEGFMEFMIECSVVWVISSIAGVYLGRYLRGRKNKNTEC